VTLGSTWHGIAFAGVGVACLLGVAAAIVVSSGVGIISIVLLIAAIGSAFVVLFDMPISTRFDAKGVVRRTPLREHSIAWDDINRLQRMRRGTLRPGVSSKGLVAMRGTRQVLLCDRTETRGQHEELRRVVGPELAEIYFTGLRSPESS
jgi:hypothetical protein